MNYKISIIVPVYDVENYLEECINSILKQTFKDFELILVNDGSKDNSGSICDSYAIKDKRIIVIHKENGGLSSARNAGFKVARGDYVLYIDSDDYIVNNALEVMYNTAEKNDIDILNVDFLNYTRIKDINDINIVLNSYEFLKQKVETNTYDMVSVLYFVKRKILLDNNMYFEEGYVYEDQLYTLRLLSIADAKVMKIQFPYYFYRSDRIGSTTNNIKLKNLVDSAYILNKMAEYISNLNTRDEKEIYNSILMFSYYQYIRIYSMSNRKHRNNKMVNLKPKTVKMALQNNRYSTKIYKTCMLFTKHRLLFFVLNYMYKSYVKLKKVLK